MIKVIIADDEPFIRNCLVSEIDWQAHGFEVVKICKNGREVVESLEICQPDVIITDIKMPYMDGLELLSYIRNYDPTVHTLVISGYEEFEYVKHAIDCNADGYLLKPVNPDELLEKMCKIRDVVLREKQERARRNDPKYILTRIVGGEDVYENLDGVSERILEMDSQFYAVACIYLADSKSFALAAEALSSLEDGSQGIFFFRRIWRNHLLLVAAKTREDAQRRAEEVVLWAQNCLEERQLPDYRIAVSNICEGLDTIPYAMEEASRTMMLRSVVNSEKAFFSWRKYSVEYRPFREDINGIVQAIRKRNKTQVKLMLDAIFQLLERKRCSFHDIRMFAENMLYTLSEDEAFPAMAQHNENYAQGLMKIYLASEPEALHQALDEIIECLCGSSEVGRENSVEGLIRETKAYIQENIADTDLSLNKIARHFNHNPSYFCYVFSNACGMTLSKYISSVRVALAKQALKNTDRRILEICEQIGCLNPNYFGKIFKRETGLTPKEYRQKYRG